jgi:hypothetical protein
MQTQKSPNDPHIRIQGIGEVYKRNMCINYFLISAHLSNSITSDNRDPNNALNSDMGVVWGLQQKMNINFH